MPLVLSCTCRDEVGACPDQRHVSSQAGSQAQRPHEGFEGKVEVFVLAEQPDHWDHGGRVGNVVQEPAHNAADPEDDDDRNDESVVLWRRGYDAAEALPDAPDEAHGRHGFDHDEERGEEEQGVPLDALEDVVKLVGSRNYHQGNSAGAGHPARVHVVDRVQEEHQQHGPQNDTALRKQHRVCDGVLPLQGLHVKFLLGDVELVLVVPLQKEEGREGSEEDAGR
mmetsp:Transcript_16202/g.30336  ORF Transcript_16202/g.30336 Transcript_16202/m.30336 type:complete len:224 (-) Transcript_16202:1257-1928(-)